MKFSILLRKELKEMLSVTTIATMFLMVFILIFAGKAMSKAVDDVKKDATTITICDQDKTDFTKMMLDVMDKMEEMEVKRVEVNSDDYTKELKDSDYKNVVIIPKGFTEQVEKQLIKLGDTIYEYGGCECDIGDMLYVSPSRINALRRQACQGLDSARAKANDRSVPFEDRDITDFEGGCECEQPKIRIEISSLKQLENIDLSDIEFVIMPLEMCKNADFAALGEKLMAVLPRFTFDEENVIERLRALKEKGLEHILATNIAHLKIGRELGLTVHGGFGLNATNSVAVKLLGEMGAADVTASFELKAAQIRALKKPVPVGVIAYGRLSAMLTVNCPIRQAVGCGKCTKRLYDPTGRELAVRCSKGEGYVEILNSDVLYMADKLNDLKGASFVQLCFDGEDPQQAADIVRAYKNGEKPQLENMTRGLYYRGII